MSEACNIGPKGIKSRWIGGFAMIAVAMAAVLLPYLWEQPKVWRLLLFVPLFVAFLSFFQAKEKT